MNSVPICLLVENTLFSRQICKSTTLQILYHICFLEPPFKKKGLIIFDFGLFSLIRMSPGSTHTFGHPLPQGNSGFAPPSALQPSGLEGHRGVEPSFANSGNLSIEQFYNRCDSPFSATDADHEPAAGDGTLRSHEQFSETDRNASFQKRVSSSSQPAQVAPLYNPQLPQNFATQPQMMEELNYGGFRLTRRETSRVCSIPAIPYRPRETWT